MISQPVLQPQPWLGCAALCLSLPALSCCGLWKARVCAHVLPGCRLGPSLLVDGIMWTCISHQTVSTWSCCRRAVISASCASSCFALTNTLPAAHLLRQVYTSNLLSHLTLCCMAQWTTRA
jgi:hypothetical protein